MNFVRGPRITYFYSANNNITTITLSNDGF